MLTKDECIGLGFEDDYSNMGPVTGHRKSNLKNAKSLLACTYLKVLLSHFKVEAVIKPQ